MIDLPIVNKQIPIFSDSYVDMEFETAHNPITKEVYIISGRRDR